MHTTDAIKEYVNIARSCRYNDILEQHSDLMFLMFSMFLLELVANIVAHAIEKAKITASHWIKQEMIVDNFSLLSSSRIIVNSTIAIITGGKKSHVKSLRRDDLT
ncbi:hypothetical protein LJC31_00720 [Synergistaceae bacterium OttesenSCG-928-I11]|nr:hypothetical protein [Synergistaceae bacterium OttesenSCG-928-I11]